MVDIVNLRGARKRKARADKERRAAENRARHGRSAAERERDRLDEAESHRILDGHHRERDNER